MGLKNPNPKTDWKAGDTACYMDTWSERIIKTRIAETFSLKKKDGGTLTAARFADGNARPLDELFVSEKNLRASYAQARENKIASYMSVIRSVNDLVAFAYTHNIAYTEEYTNYEAREAYRRKAKELLNLDLS